jgi:hypothetical protein
VKLQFALIKDKRLYSSPLDGGDSGIDQSGHSGLRKAIQLRSAAAPPTIPVLPLGTLWHENKH